MFTHDRKNGPGKNSLEKLLNKQMTVSFYEQHHQSLGNKENLIPRSTAMSHKNVQFSTKNYKADKESGMCGLFTGGKNQHKILLRKPRPCIYQTRL